MTSPNYDFHIFICQNQRPSDAPRGCCMSKNADHIINHMKKIAKQLGIENIRINKSGCLNQCEQGVAAVIYPDATWYSIKSIEDGEKIIRSHLFSKKLVKDLLLK